MFADYVGDVILGNSTSSIEESVENLSLSAETGTDIASSSVEMSNASPSLPMKQSPTYVNPQGVRFTSGEDEDPESDKALHKK